MWWAVNNYFAEYEMQPCRTRQGWFLFIMCMPLISLQCQSNQNIELASPEIRLDSFSIASGFGQENVSLVELDGQPYFTEYNELRSHIILAPMNAANEAAPILINRPSELKEKVIGYKIFSLDSILFLSRSDIAICDQQGNTTYYWYFDSLPFYANHTSRVVVNDMLGWLDVLSLEKEPGAIFCRQYSYQYRITDSRFYSVPIEAKIDLNKKEIVQLPITYPKVYSDAFLGDAMDLYRCVVDDDQIVYSFEASPFLYTINLDGDLNGYDGKSQFHKTQIQALDTLLVKNMDIRMNHLIESPLYGKILFDPYRRLYYRFFNQGVPLQDSLGNFNNLGDKKLFLIVFDEAFNKLKELELDNSHRPKKSFVGKKGLYIRYHNGNSAYEVYKIYTWS